MKNSKIWKGIATIVCAGCLVLTACTGSEIKARFTLNEQGELICTYPDGSEENLGRVMGEDGADGRDGTNGKDGLDGRDGLDGENGSDGKDGHDGIDGTDGVGIASTTTDANGNTVVTYTDGTVQVIEHRWDYVSTLREATPWVAGADLYGCGDCGITKVVYEKYEDSHYTKGLDYMLNKDGESYTVIGPGSSTDANVIIPETYNGKPVTGLYFIGIPHALYYLGYYWLKSITLPKSIENIEYFSFDVQNIYVSEENENYKSIDGVLYSKDGKTLIRYPMGRRDPYFTVPEHVTTIEEWAFYNAYYLISITIGENVTDILGRYTFTSCLALEEVYNLTTIEDFTVNTHWMGHSVEHIYTSAEEKSRIRVTDDGFVFCAEEDNYKLLGYTGENIEKIVLPESYEGEKYVIDKFAFFDYTQLKTVVISDGVKEILGNIFYNCASLKNIIIGKEAKTIDFTLFINYENIDIYYCGTEEERNANITDKTVGTREFTWYYYSEEEPTEEGNYWRYVDGEAVKW